MLRNKFSRHTTSFLTIALASIFLYLAVQAGLIAFIWILLGLVVIAAILTLLTK